ncbi:MAG TPA: DUF4287 domain-containing protein [Candidatus Dormibacteraeota bacterium]
MSFKAYIDNIKAKTGKSPEDFVQLAAEKGLLGEDVKASRILDWLQADYGLGRGHGMAVVTILRSASAPPAPAGQRLGEHFKGKKSRWQPVYEDLAKQVRAFGNDVSVGAGGTYLSLLRKGRKFGIVQVTADRIDVGIKLKDLPAGGRFEAAGGWNSMVTHRVRIVDPNQVDGDLVAHLERAYAAAGT